MAAMSGELVSVMGPPPCPPSPTHAGKRVPWGCHLQIQPSFLAYTPPWGAVQMTQAWREERASKGGWGWGAESVAEAKEKVPPIICV